MKIIFRVQLPIEDKNAQNPVVWLFPAHFLSLNACAYLADFYTLWNIVTLISVFDTRQFFFSQEEPGK